MAILECKMCGGSLTIQQGSAIAECQNCGRIQTIPKPDDERKIGLFNRANRARVGNEFDKAAALYETILAEFSQEAEAYWGLVLCKYGIEYVDDAPTGKKIPTCHRTAYDSILHDDNYAKTLSYAEKTAKAYYEQEALQLEEIRKGIIEVSSKEEPYDIFICYKETDPHGMRTMDSVIAQDIYQLLTNQGYRVFFSRISLEDKLGVKYEPYIFAALNSAKVMLVVGTQAAHFQAVWVRNEWSRFLQIISANREKRLFAVYKNMAAYDLPAELQPLQSLDYGKLGADQDLLHGIEKIIPVLQKTAEKHTTPVEADSVEAQALKLAQEGKVLEGMRLLQQKLGYSVRESKDVIDSLRFGRPIPERKRETVTPTASPISSTPPVQPVAKTKVATPLAEIRQAIAPLKRLSKGSNGVQMLFDDGTVGEYSCTRQGARMVKIIARDPQIVGLDNGRAIRENDNLLKYEHIFGELYLFKDGTMRAVNAKSQMFEDRIGEWSDIVDFASDSNIVVGVRRNGELTYENRPDAYRYSAYKIEEAVPYVMVKAGMGFWGLRADGTVKHISSGLSDSVIKVEAWRDIVAISVCSTCIVGLKADGTVEQATLFGNRGFDVSQWRGIVDVCAGDEYIAGVNVYGEVLVTATSGLDFDPRKQLANKDTPEFRLRGYEPVYKLPDLNLFDSKAEEFAGFYEQMGDPQQKNNPVRHLYTQVPVGTICGVIPPIKEVKHTERNEKSELVTSLQKRKRELYAEKNNLKGFFAGKRRKEIEAEMAEIDKKLKQELGIL